MDAASIEQMNKVRVSLGMAPLPVPGKDSSGPQFKPAGDGDDSDQSDELSTLDKRQAAAGANWQKLEDERLSKEEREKRKLAAKKARDVAARYAKMDGKGLGEADEGEMDTRSWLLSQKKRTKKIEKTRKLQEELAAREHEAMQQEYTSKDLAGVKVGHEAGEFDEATGEQVLTLKDTAIGEESEDDELENAEMRAKEKLEQNLRLKKKQPDYDPTEDGEANVLSKYDEEIDGKKSKRFTLDGGSNAAEVRRSKEGDGEAKSKGVKISLDMLKEDAPASDYVEPSIMKIRKPKKQKKEKKTRQKEADEDDILAPVTDAPLRQPEADVMDVDSAQPAASSKKRALEFDDDDLQAKLAEQRRHALKKRKKMDASELARQMRDEMPVDDEEAEDAGFVMDETSEFVANLKPPEAPAVRDATSRTPHPAIATDEAEDEDGDTAMATQSYAEAADAEDRPSPVPAAATHDMTATGLEDEDTLSGAGTGAALAMLRKRGLLTDASVSDLSTKDRSRMKFLAEKQHLIDDYDLRARREREEARSSGRFAKMSKREQEEYQKRQNEDRERYLARLQAEKFNKEYRPEVTLRYNDEYGREMNQKEAFKHMSHLFHGKGSGKQKTEKRMKKVEEEKAREARGLIGGGEGGGFVDVQGREGRRLGKAGVRLQ
ncbi:hypothetical protein LTR53_005587 [Teratosphaeriaceae sp. CCFEE 6253]|nr:hypothetical protein LTR53_005587 [Teratosphaeriaceae sp. CCFEE 6253]